MRQPDPRQAHCNAPADERSATRFAQTGLGHWGRWTTCVDSSVEGARSRDVEIAEIDLPTLLGVGLRKIHAQGESCSFQGIPVSGLCDQPLKLRAHLVRPIEALD